MSKVKIIGSAASIPSAEWDACAGHDNPFVSHAFFTALEASASASAEKGWQPVHLLINDANGHAAAIAPAYAKSHSQGEYVFDQGWAEAFARAGGRYYPKLQLAVPFSPVPGPRLLLRDRDQAPALISAIEEMTNAHGLSSAHATFISSEQVETFSAQGWLIRTDQQFHWTNDNYSSFDDFLAVLQSRKRKDLRKERQAALADGISIVHLSGADIKEQHWDIFWSFYQSTAAKKWARPYLNRHFFSLLSETMSEKILLVFAMRGDTPIAGALNLIGSDTLYGRYWGCIEDVPFLHFELCYYQAIDYAIAHKLKRVEAGAQGAHKLARGYRPTPTWSAHYIAHSGFRDAVAQFLEHERQAVAEDMKTLDGYTPFKKSL